MTSKELIEVLESRLNDLSCRNVYPTPEEDKNLNKLLQMMNLAYTNWKDTDFKAVPKDVVSSHTLKW